MNIYHVVAALDGEPHRMTVCAINKTEAVGYAQRDMTSWARGFKSFRHIKTELVGANPSEGPGRWDPGCVLLSGPER